MCVFEFVVNLGGGGNCGTKHWLIADIVFYFCWRGGGGGDPLTVNGSNIHTVRDVLEVGGERIPYGICFQLGASTVRYKSTYRTGLLVSTR